MKTLGTKIKRLMCKWFGHKLRIKRVEYDRFAVRWDWCQRCGMESEWEIEAYDTPAYTRRGKEKRERKSE